VIVVPTVPPGCRGSIKEDRRSRLSALPRLDVGDPYADQWDERFNLLLEYVKHYGTALVPTSYTTDDGFELGKWVAVQRNF
jgi:hypothetical protein